MCFLLNSSHRVLGSENCDVCWTEGETEILKVNLMAELGWFRSPELKLCGLSASFDIHNLLKGQK